MGATVFWLLFFAVWGNGAVLRRSDAEFASEHPELLQDPTYVASEELPPITSDDPTVTSISVEDLIPTAASEDPSPTLLDPEEFPAPESTLSGSPSIFATQELPSPTATDLLIPTSSPGSSLQSVVVTASATTKTYFFGELDEPTRTATSAVPSATVDWNSLFKSYNCGPVRRPGTTGGNQCSNFSGPRPKVVDWRDRWGVNWLATVQDQGSCGSCWAFAATGVTETIARIQHGVWNKRSEGELKEASGTHCSGWKAKFALEWIQQDTHGHCDYTCDPYEPFFAPYATCADRPGRALEIYQVYELKDIEEQKRWLWQVGPLAGGIDAYGNFGSWKPSMGVYNYDPAPGEGWGGHAMLIVGYDDNRSCWIVRNSWGDDFGDAGYIYIGYGKVAIDDDRRPKYGVTNISPDPRARRRHANGNIIQTGDGSTHRDIEVLRRTRNGSIAHLVRQAEEPYSWTKQETIYVKDHKHWWWWPFGRWRTSVKGQPGFVETSFARRKEMVYWDDSHDVYAHWAYNEVNGSWIPMHDVTGNRRNGQIRGYPGFIETDDSGFMVAGRVKNGLAEFKQPATADRLELTQMITTDNIKQSGPSLVQSNIGNDVYDSTTSGNLYVVAVTKDGSLQMFWRRWGEKGWRVGEKFAAGYNIGKTPPVMIQDFWAKDENAFGGFQLLVAHNGHVDHFQRLNDDIVQNPPVAGVKGKWKLVHSFAYGKKIKHVWGLAQGSFNHALEAIVEDDRGDLWHWEYTGSWKQVAKLP